MRDGFKFRCFLYGEKDSILPCCSALIFSSSECLSINRRLIFLMPRNHRDLRVGVILCSVLQYPSYSTHHGVCKNLRCASRSDYFLAFKETHSTADPVGTQLSEFQFIPPHHRICPQQYSISLALKKCLSFPNGGGYPYCLILFIITFVVHYRVAVTRNSDYLWFSYPVSTTACAPSIICRVER